MPESNNIGFKLAKEEDISFMLKTYKYYIINSTATFHTEALELEEIKKSLPLNHHLYKTYIILNKEIPCGFCYIDNFKPRQAYNRSAEVTLYLAPELLGKGIGTTTLEFLETQAKKTGIKNLLGVITAENKGSVKLFEKAGYTKVGHLRNIGEKFGRILDVVTYQKEI